MVFTASMGEKFGARGGPNIQTQAGLGRIRIQRRGEYVEKQSGQSICPLKGQSMVFVRERLGSGAFRKQELIPSSGCKDGITALECRGRRDEGRESGRREAADPFEQKLRIRTNQIQNLKEIVP